ncbi:hypothetical protein NUU61_004502 [Penicillium alfredii]|uniref:DNA polymerase delta subunit 4 n=1 Tax=Penicillium alfredii TaxID=1506179 RepID=A0A9W9FLB1_9EURO|nr:uncharacterized protein NUU61_004502 [Penicillium alfredii]KAJ5102280.1 hypothetical protein NUU61_004502 [Penicillium alfredii]
MPPRRRGGNTASSRAAQSTLSFGARVTKPATPSANLKAKNLDSPVSLPTDKSASATPEPQQVPVTPVEPSQPHVAELVVRQQAAAEIQAPLSMEDKRAMNLSRQDLQRYWEKEEQSRKAPRVHQQSLDLEEKILRHFDLSSQYGPCIGIARLKRWRRANMLNLNPPIEVLAVLLTEKDVKQRANMDDLLS